MAWAGDGAKPKQQAKAAVKAAVKASAPAMSQPVPMGSGTCYLWACPTGIIKGRYCIDAKASPPCGDNGNFEGECECGSKYRNGVKIN